MILRLTMIVCLLISAYIATSLTSTSPQCCPPGYSVNPDRVSCVSGDKELQVEGMDSCKGDMEVVDTRYTKISSHGSKFRHTRSFSLYLPDYSGLLYQDTAPSPGQFCLSGLVSIVCSSCLSGLCIQQCCPPGQVRREDQAWRQARCGRGEEGQVAATFKGNISRGLLYALGSYCVCYLRVTTG